MIMSITFSKKRDTDKATSWLHFRFPSSCSVHCVLHQAQEAQLLSTVILLLS